MQTTQRTPKRPIRNMFDSNMALVMAFNSSLVYTLQELHVMVRGEDPRKKTPPLYVIDPRR
jgi:predicted GH43/DUF377 family glycosyl hydrolase